MSERIPQRQTDAEIAAFQILRGMNCPPVLRVRIVYGPTWRLVPDVPVATTRRLGVCYPADAVRLLQNRPDLKTTLIDAYEIDVTKDVEAYKAIVIDEHHRGHTKEVSHSLERNASTSFWSDLNVKFGQSSEDEYRVDYEVPFAILAIKVNTDKIQRRLGTLNSN